MKKLLLAYILGIIFPFITCWLVGCNVKPKVVKEFTFDIAVTFINGDQDTVTISSIRTTQDDVTPYLSHEGCLCVYTRNSGTTTYYCGVRKFDILQTKRTIIEVLDTKP